MASSSSLRNTSVANACSAQAFYTHFGSATTALVAQLSDTTTHASLQHALHAYAALNAQLTQAVDSGVLPRHDQAVHRSSLEQLAAALERQRRIVDARMHGEHTNKAGFAFKRKQPSATTPMPPMPTMPTIPTIPTIPTMRSETQLEPPNSSHVCFSTLRNARYTHTNAPTPHSSCPTDTCTSVALTDICESAMDLSTLSSSTTVLSVQIRSISHSVLLLPRIEGSVMLHDVTHSIVVIPSCHQFRMHTSRDVVVELCTKRGSVVTLESCTRIRLVTRPDDHIKVQDFDDLINSEPFKQQQQQQQQQQHHDTHSNFTIIQTDTTSLAERISSVWETCTLLASSIDQIVSELEGAA